MPSDRDQRMGMSKSLKIFVAALLLGVTALGFMLTRQPGKPAWDGSALLAKAEQALEGLPAKEAAEIRAYLVSTGPDRYDDRASAWFKAAMKGNLEPVGEYAVASLRAMAEAGDAEAMWHLHFVLTQRIATGDEGFEWLEKSAKLGYPRAVFDVTSKNLRTTRKSSAPRWKVFPSKRTMPDCRRCTGSPSATKRARTDCPRMRPKRTTIVSKRRPWATS